MLWSWFQRFVRFVYRNPIAIVIGIILLVVLARFSWKAPLTQEPAPPLLPKVAVQDMAARPITTRIQINGHTAEVRRVTLEAKTSGRILSLVTTKGKKVKKDQNLVIIDLENRPDRLAEAKARLYQRSLELEANKKLKAKAVTSQNTLAASMADYESARSALTHIEQEIADTRIKAPFNGIFEEKFVEIGDLVNVGEKIATIIDLDPLKITCHISEKDISRIDVGKKGHVTLPSLQNQKLPVCITYRAKAADPQTRTYRVEMQAPNPDMAIPAGLTARIYLPTGQSNGYLISPATVSLKDDGTIGVKTVEEGKVAFYPIQIIETKPEGLLVTGLPDQIRLITVGGDFVLEGQLVEAHVNSFGNHATGQSP